ncbi:MAG: PhoH family protein [Proteobacteria bacterium]|nr:PhoH family protein [Pseudomonadota bacterium]
MTTNVTLEPNDTRRLAALCGPFDQNLKHLEKRLGLQIRSRGNLFQIRGPAPRVKVADALLSQLYRETNSRDSIEPDLVHLFLQESGVDELLAQREKELAGQTAEPGSVIHTSRKTIKPRGGNQTSYVHAIRKHDISFGIGPAGTGKTYLAVACGVEALEQERIRRILLVRPAVEAGEKLGFLPGDLSQKINPYLRPLYDALYELLGFDRVEKLIEKNVIEVAPLAYMRGRTLNDAFIILDESQNTTVEQMKMFLTRIGFGSNVVVTGDITQIDLPHRTKSGLRHVLGVLRGVTGISFTRFSPKDVVRHPLVQRIVEAYERHEKPDDSQKQPEVDPRQD